MEAKSNQAKVAAEAQQTQMDMAERQKEHEFKMLQMERKDTADQRAHQRKMTELNAAD